MDENLPLTVECARKILEGAFLPYKCFTAYRQHSGLILFRVYQGEKPIIHDARADRNEYTDRYELEKLIRDLRQMAEDHNGNQFDPWVMPLD